MRRLITISFLIGCSHATPPPAAPTAPPAPAAAAPTLAAAAPAPPPPPAWLAKLPPIIDREIFFGDPEYAGAQLSPDGKFISFLKDYKGQLNVWVKRREEPFTAA